MLLAWAGVWLSAATGPVSVALGGLGLAIAILAWWLLFRGLAAKNIERLTASPERACLFGFQAPKGYLMMGSMIALGVTLRHSAIPKPDLAVVYIAIGGALLLASMSYYSRLLGANTGGAS
jgi:hypothetical protein